MAAARIDPLDSTGVAFVSRVVSLRYGFLPRILDETQILARRDLAEDYNRAPVVGPPPSGLRPVALL